MHFDVTIGLPQGYVNCIDALKGI